LEHANTLKVCLGIPQDDLYPLPEKAIENYWLVKAAADRIGAPMTDQLLIMIAAMSGDLARPDPPRFRDLVANGEVRPGDIVCVLWRKKTVEAGFVSVMGRDKVIVSIDGNERAVDENTVSLREPVLAG
jgi:hypothetical protein